ncbi:FecR family protein [Noviherbaspirillum sp.]|uniref:FecR family protein n=1 Tax=Noviherbaspirillum sp. TaxID=1926288 RepID=UPI002B492F4C|nr:FecR family protein [Noviherbaspirillum sp.]HJV80176.1 FecR family protein [Noviherbaspirillum sp.]
MKPLRLAVFSILLALGASSAAADTLGEILIVHGKVFLQKEGTRLRIPVLPGQLVHGGDVYQTATGAHLQLRLRFGELLILRAESRVMIDDASPNESRLRLDQGVLRFICANRPAKNQPFHVRTTLAMVESGDAGATIDADEDSTRLTVAVGKASMTPLNSQCSPEKRTSECDNAKAFLTGTENMMLVLKKGEAAAQAVPANNPDFADLHRFMESEPKMPPRDLPIQN